MADRTLSLGEALVDVVIRNGARTEHVGGSLLNVAVGLATLGRPTSLCSYWGRDARGDVLQEWAHAAGVDIVGGTDEADRTSVAYARIDQHGHASYEFDLTWAVPQLPELSGFGHLHTGSIAAVLEPGGSAVVAAAAQMRAYGTVSYDPNIRPALMHTPTAVTGRVEQLVALADVVKASDEDLGWLYPGVPVEDTMRRWLDSGPALVVITRGASGADALLAADHDIRHLDALPIPVADTVGAGDSFLAGLVSGLLDAELLGSGQARQRLSRADWSAVQPALRRATAAGALTVGRIGAYAPSPAEVAALLETDPLLS